MRVGTMSKYFVALAVSLIIPAVGLSEIFAVRPLICLIIFPFLHVPLKAR